jgi:hypothetical protein
VRGSRPEDAPVGYIWHEWVAALIMPVGPEEVRRFQRKADVVPTKSTTGRVQVDRAAEVMDVYCRRCGARPGRQEWCPRDPMRVPFTA